ncbi:hypothetical protein C5167_040224 [Papaver somniferum]|uniref:Uncharacterized protein n=1 Tax=Papaver somniferum TaxID=3469 RepID=A0A4Y7IHR3_PAPSO|nr:hypothetical protein C5167_040224 [Papaver somniferum]
MHICWDRVASVSWQDRGSETMFLTALQGLHTHQGIAELEMQFTSNIVRGEHLRQVDIGSSPEFQLMCPRKRLTTKLAVEDDN